MKMTRYLLILFTISLLGSCGESSLDMEMENSSLLDFLILKKKELLNVNWFRIVKEENNTN